MLEIATGKEEEFRYWQAWLIASDWLDKLIVAAEDPAPSEPKRKDEPVWHALYVAEKLRELDAQRLSQTPPLPPNEPRPLLRPLARGVGRTLSRLGQRLEAWAAPVPGQGTALPRSLADPDC